MIGGVNFSDLQWTTTRYSHAYTVLSPRTEAGPVTSNAVNMHSYRVELILCQFQASALRKPGNWNFCTLQGPESRYKKYVYLLGESKGKEEESRRIGGRKGGMKRERWHWGAATPKFQLTPATTKASHRLTEHSILNIPVLAAI